MPSMQKSNLSVWDGIVTNVSLLKRRFYDSKNAYKQTSTWLSNQKKHFEKFPYSNLPLQPMMDF